MEGEAEPQGALEGPLLNGPQSEAARHVDGPMVVFAGAGSGKTRVITYRIANLLATHRIPPYRILAVTFTNKAAGEMKRRLGAIVGDELTRDLWVGTFHSVCARLLRRHHAAAGLSRSFVIYDDDDQRAVMSRVYKELRIDDKRFPPRQVLGRIHKEKQEGITAADFIPGDFMERTIAQCFTAYDARLADANALDFDDLLIRTLKLAEDTANPVGGELSRRFSFVLVDEFQDVNQVQYRLVRALSHGSGNLVVVGDDDQSIYRWRGADVRIVRNFRKDHPGAKIVKLEENYRSSANVVAAALGVIKSAKDREPKQLFTSNEKGDPISVVACDSERDEAAFVAERIADAISAGESPAEIAVFYRVHAQSRVLEEVLRSERIPYQVVGGMRFFERAEIKDLIAYLRLLANPASDVDLARIVNVPSRKIGDATIEKLAAFASESKCSFWAAVEPLCKSDRLGPQPKKALARFHAFLADLMGYVETGSPRELAERVLEESGYLKMLELEGTDEAEGRMQNLQEFVGSIGEYEEEALAAGDVPTLPGFLEKVALTSVADELKDAPKVSLMTVHAAKGLEFNRVFITGLEEDMFPFKSQDPTREGDLEEERRLAYVAITRARRQLYMLHAGRRMVFGNTRYNLPSRYLAELPPEVVHQVSTETKKSLGGRFIDRVGWAAPPPARDPGPTWTPRGEGAPRPPSAQPKLAWSKPQREEEPQAKIRARDEGPAQRDLFVQGDLFAAPALAEDGLPVRPRHAAEPRREAAPALQPGERFIERDDDAAPSGGYPSSLGRRAAQRAEAVRGLNLRIGSHVAHKTFGRGVVLAVDDSHDPTATVKFAGWGPKRIKALYLEPVD